MLDWYSIDLELGGRMVLRQVDFRLRSGERVGILGPSGAGKSSLLRLAAGILKAQRGNQQSSFRHAVLAFQSRACCLGAEWPRTSKFPCARPVVTRRRRDVWLPSGWSG